ncbi:MAG: DASS family sodium-coupled anion symporter [Bacteroidota bacterium]
MADSRGASTRLLDIQRVVNYQGKIIAFLSSILIALFLTFQLRDVGFSETQDYVLFLLFFATGLWVSEAIPPFATGIMIVGFLVFFLGSDYFNTHPESVKKYVNTWSDSVIWLMLGGFFMAEALKKLRLDREIFLLASKRFGTDSQTLLLGLMLATTFGSMLMSNTATAAMMVASVGPLLTKLKPDSPYGKSLLLGIAAAASIGGMGTIIGSPANAIAVGSLENLGIKISFLGWMSIGVPLSVLFTLGLWWLLIKRFPHENRSLDLGEIFDEKPQTISQGRIFQRKLVLGILVSTVLLWLSSAWHQIPVAAISGVPILFLTMLGIINGDDVRKLPWDTLMLIAGGLSLGLAIQETGLAQYFVSKLPTDQLGLLMLLLIFGLGTTLFSNIMSNTAAATVLIPLAGVLSPQEPTSLAVTIGLCASCALFLPVSTPPNAIVFATGKLHQNDFRLAGISVGILGPLLIIAWVMMAKFWL